MKWDPFSITEWARALGLAKIPVFFNSLHSAVLLDGAASSCLFSSDEDAARALHELDPLAWAWSSQLRHLVVLNHSSGEIFLRHWDAPSEQTRLKAPSSPADAELFLNRASKYRPKAPDVVTQMVAAFKTIRGIFSAYDPGGNLAVVHMFNLIVESLTSESGLAELERCKTVADVMAAFVEAPNPLENILEQFKNANIEHALAIFGNASPSGLPPMDPRLLIRHASGQLYQEAHFELERQPTGQMSLFGGRVPNLSLQGSSKRDARFTPSTLARALAEQALRELRLDAPLTILDPACGCGVFLQEVIRELEVQKFRHPVKLIGIDTSEISIAIAKFCMESASLDAERSGLKVEADLRIGNSLRESWGTPNLILMNPPFVSYRDMDPAERSEAQSILGNAARGHFDKSMAFILKGVRSLAPCGVMASVLPSVLLNSTNGELWRNALVENAKMTAVGRFRGYSYFPGAMVEPAFIILQTNPQRITSDGSPLTVLVADEGYEDAALRALRKQSPWSDTVGEHFTVSTSSGRAGTDTNWMPTSLGHQRLLAMRGLREMKL